MRVLLSLTVAFAAAIVSSSTFAQNSQRSVVIGTMTTRPNALLILNPPGANQGFLLPQLTTSSRVAMRPSSPEEDGLLVFDINEKEFYYWKDNSWIKGLGIDNQTFQTLSFDPATRKLTLSNGNTVDISQSTTVNTPTLQSYSIDSSDFFGAGNDRPDKDNAVIFEDNTTFISISKRGEASKLIAPIHLPDGATIQQILLYYVDRDGQNLSFAVTRRPYTGANDNVVPAWTSSGNSSVIQTATHTPIAGKEVIDNSLYSYRIIIDLNPTTDANNSNEATHRIYGVQIKYVK